MHWHSATFNSSMENKESMTFQVHQNIYEADNLVDKQEDGIHSMAGIVPWIWEWQKQFKLFHMLALIYSKGCQLEGKCHKESTWDCSGNYEGWYLLLLSTRIVHTDSRKRKMPLFTKGFILRFKCICYSSLLIIAIVREEGQRQGAQEVTGVSKPSHKLQFLLHVVSYSL